MKAKSKHTKTVTESTLERCDAQCARGVMLEAGTLRAPFPLANVFCDEKFKSPKACGSEGALRETALLRAPKHGSADAVSLPSQPGGFISKAKENWLLEFEVKFTSANVQVISKYMSNSPVSPSKCCLPASNRSHRNLLQYGNSHNTAATFTGKLLCIYMSGITSPRYRCRAFFCMAKG